MPTDDAEDLLFFDQLFPGPFFAVLAANLRSRSTTKCCRACAACSRKHASLHLCHHRARNGSRKDRIKEMSAEEAQDLLFFDQLFPGLFFAVLAANLRS